MGWIAKPGVSPSPMIRTTVRRGDVVLVELDPVVGSEAAKRRPCVVVSNDERNTVSVRNRRGVITVVPVTSNVQRVYDFQVYLPSERTGLPLASKAQAEQVRSVDVARAGRRVGRVPDDLLAELDDALRLHLDL